MPSARKHETRHAYGNIYILNAQRLHGVRNVSSHDHGPPPGMRHEREIAKERPRAPKMRCARLLLLLRRRHGCREGCLWPTAQPHGPGRLCRCPHKRRFSAVHARATPRERASRGMRARMSKMHGSMHGMREIRLHRTRTRKQRASVYTPGQRNDPTNENSTAASKCLREATHRVEKINYACMRATRTRHRPGVSASKCRRTRGRVVSAAPSRSDSM